MRRCWLAIIVILVIPILLNLVLQMETPNACNVISDNDSGPGIWLAFWGAYLAAIGSFIMAWVSYNQNKKQSQMHDIEIKIREAEALYCDLEKFVLDVKRVHAWHNVENIIKNSTSIDTKELSEWRIRVYEISNQIVRFNSIFNDSKFHKYGEAVAQINRFCVNDIIACFEKNNIPQQDKLRGTMEQHISNLINLEMDVLLNERERINDLYKKLESIND